MILLLLVGCTGKKKTETEELTGSLKNKVLINKGQILPALLGLDINDGTLDRVSGFAFDDNLTVSHFEWTGIYDLTNIMHSTYNSLLDLNYSHKGNSVNSEFRLLEGTEFFAYVDPLVQDHLTFVYKVFEIEGKSVLKKYLIEDLIAPEGNLDFISINDFPERSKELENVELNDKEVALFQEVGDYSYYEKLEKALFEEVALID